MLLRAGKGIDVLYLATIPVDLAHHPYAAWTALYAIKGINRNVAMWDRFNSQKVCKQVLPRCWVSTVASAFCCWTAWCGMVLSTTAGCKVSRTQPCVWSKIRNFPRRYPNSQGERTVVGVLNWHKELLTSWLITDKWSHIFSAWSWQRAPVTLLRREDSFKLIHRKERGSKKLQFGWNSRAGPEPSAHVISCTYIIWFHQPWRIRE